ncbi:hypothetical protein [Actinoplanes sp. NPDC051494]
MRNTDMPAGDDEGGNTTLIVIGLIIVFLAAMGTLVYLAVGG